MSGFRSDVPVESEITLASATDEVLGATITRSDRKTEITSPLGYAIEVPSPRSKRPLFYQYPSECFPQDAFLEIRQGSAEWTYNMVIGGGVPLEAWHGVVIRVPCNNALSHEELVELSIRHAALIDTIIEAMDEDWDGQNTVGMLTADGEVALHALAAALATEAERHRGGNVFRRRLAGRSRRTSSGRRGTPAWLGRYLDAPLGKAWDE